MIVQTVYSSYRVTAHGKEFHIQKLSLDNIEAVYMNGSGFEKSAYLDLAIGQPMRFYNLVTSPVVSVIEEKHG